MGWVKKNPITSGSRELWAHSGEHDESGRLDVGGSVRISPEALQSMKGEPEGGDKTLVVNAERRGALPWRGHRQFEGKAVNLFNETSWQVSPICKNTE